jgi:hypothetical protein
LRVVLTTRYEIGESSEPTVEVEFDQLYRVRHRNKDVALFILLYASPSCLQIERKATIAHVGQMVNRLEKNGKNIPKPMSFSFPIQPHTGPRASYPTSPVQFGTDLHRPDVVELTPFWVSLPNSKLR